MFKSVLEKLSSVVGTIFNKTFSLVEFLFSEIFNLVEWSFKVGTRLLLLYLLYDLVVSGLITQVLESL